MSGSFKTETGCVVSTRPGPDDLPGTTILSLRVDHPASVGYFKVRDAEPDLIQYSEVLLSELDRLALGSILDAQGILREIRDAWTVPGAVPAYHYAAQETLRRQWPTLAAAIEKMVLAT